MMVYVGRMPFVTVTVELPNNKLEVTLKWIERQYTHTYMPI